MQEIQDTVSRRALYRRCKTLRRCKIHTVSMRSLYKRCKHVGYAGYCKHESVVQEMQACRIPRVCNICKQESRWAKDMHRKSLYRRCKTCRRRKICRILELNWKSNIFTRGASYARGAKYAGGARQEGQPMYSTGGAIQAKGARYALCRIKTCFKLLQIMMRNIPLNSVQVVQLMRYCK